MNRRCYCKWCRTITQQYARLLYLTNEKTWSRKVKEAFFTLQLETHLSKKEILEGYINNVYFGHGIYGIENASQYFYGKKAKELTLNEGIRASIFFTFIFVSP